LVEEESSSFDVELFFADEGSSSGAEANRGGEDIEKWRTGGEKRSRRESKEKEDEEEAAEVEEIDRDSHEEVRRGGDGKLISSRQNRLLLSLSEGPGDDDGKDNDDEWNGDDDECKQDDDARKEVDDK